MPEIRITRSAGNNWNAKFGPEAQNPANPDGATLTHIETVLKHVGPLGPAGNTAQAATELAALTDVAVINPAPGDVLRYANDNKWHNYNEINLTDGGNF